MPTARNIIKRSMQKAGILTKTEDPSADEAADALQSLNNLLGTWSNRALDISARAWETFTLSGGVTSYTIGAGQTFNTSRPVKIVEAYIRQPGNTDTPLDIIDDEQYNQIQSKSTQGLPYFLSYDNAYPSATIRLYPVPSSAYQLFILSEKPLTSFTLDQNVDYPAGWEDAIISNLAIRLAPEYGQPVSADLREEANSSHAEIMIAIARNRPIAQNPSTGGVDTIYTGYYN